MVTRRRFIKVIISAGAGAFLVGRMPAGVADAGIDAPRQTVRLFMPFISTLGVPLPAAEIQKYGMPLLIPPVMPQAGTVALGGGKSADYYEISMRQFRQKILPDSFYQTLIGDQANGTLVWGYGAVASVDPHGLLLHNAPSLTIEAKVERPVRVKWINDLIDKNGNYLPHLLPVDPTLDWANPSGGMAGRDSRPDYTGKPTPGSYTGPVPNVPHVHGAVGVGDESDGYAQAWYLPAAKDVPVEYATEGKWYDFFKAKAANSFGATWGSGYAVFQYPNLNRAGTIWYHDHTMGMTRLNVYAGPAGFYIIRGGPDGDQAVLDSRTKSAAILPGPAPAAGDPFPPDKTYFEIPIAIQDRSFNAEGSLFYPNSREFFDGATESLPGYIPDTDISPIWNPEYFGNAIMVNGNTWPYLDVQKRRYRIRFLNGCQSRFLILDFGEIPGVDVWQIANEGGFLATPVHLSAPEHRNRLLMALAERADLIVDFTNVPKGNYVLRNLGPDEPFGGGDPFWPPPPEGEALPDGTFLAADPQTTGQILQFRVGPALAADPTTPPQYLTLPVLTPLPAANRTRRLALLEKASTVWDGPVEAMLGVVDDTGNPVHLEFMEDVTENPSVGDTEIWEIYNFTADAHPMHVHEVAFEVIDRQALHTNDFGETEAPVQLVGVPRPPEPWETGVKDTVIVYPGEVTRIKSHFAHPGQFVWHCHIVEHEDNEMMRPFRIGPMQPGQPM